MTRRHRQTRFTRRRFLAITGAAGATGAVTTWRLTDDRAGKQGRAANFEAHFAHLALAEEPEGDLDRVVWPDFVLTSDPEIQRLYAFHVTNGGLMRYMPCFCGCIASGGHMNNRDCYIQAVHADGSVTFDPMAPT